MTKEKYVFSEIFFSIWKLIKGIWVPNYGNIAIGDDLL